MVHGGRSMLGRLLRTLQDAHIHTSFVFGCILASYVQLVLDLGLEELLLLDQHILRLAQLLYRLAGGGGHVLLAAKHLPEETHPGWSAFSLPNLLDVANKICFFSYCVSSRLRAVLFVCVTRYR